MEIKFELFNSYLIQNQLYILSKRYYSEYEWGGKITIHKKYPFFVLICLLPITYLSIEFNNLIILPFVTILLIIGHPNPPLLLTEIAKLLGFGSDFKSIHGLYSDYKLFIDEILEENNVDCDVVIIDDGKIGLYAGKSTFYISKGFVEYWFKLVPLNDKEGKIKILSLLGHELTHQKGGFWSYIKEFFKAYMVFLIFFILFIVIISLLGINTPFFTNYIFSLSLFLIVFYIGRKFEFMADEGGVKIANDNTGIILFLKTADSSVKNGYQLWDKFYELFSFHPHSIKRIKKIEKLKS